jgi:hypothetical protein
MLKVQRDDTGILKGIDLIKNVSADYIDVKGNVHQASLNLIPYYAWNNRGVSTMNIWFAENEKKVRESVAILPVSIKDIKATYTNEGEMYSLLLTASIRRILRIQK